MRGTIVNKRDEGFGFIKPDEGDKDVFFHATAISEGTSFDELSAGDVVTFDIEEGPKGPAAANVMKAEAAPVEAANDNEAPTEEAEGGEAMAA